MVARAARALCICALLQAMAAGVAGCSTSVDGGATPVGGEPGGGQGLGIDVDAGDPAGGGGCDGESCDVYQQCGCGAGQACDLDGADLASGATECREVASPGQTQSNCDSADQCAAGYSCLGNPGQCRKMCDEDGDCGAGYCVVQVVFENDEGAFEDVPNARACTKQCTPESGFDSGCPAEPDLGCRVFTDDPDAEAGSGDERDYTDCTASGTGRDTADCSQNGDADCAPGFGCYVISYTDDTQADECREICVVDVGGVPQSNRCGEGTCNGFATRSLIGDVEYGVCF